jgi:hypothetical protein
LNRRASAGIYLIGIRRDHSLDAFQVRIFLSRSRGMMNTPQLAARFLGVAIFYTARQAARSFIFPGSRFLHSKLHADSADNQFPRYSF